MKNLGIARRLQALGRGETRINNLLSVSNASKAACSVPIISRTRDIIYLTVIVCRLPGPKGHESYKRAPAENTTTRVLHEETLHIVETSNTHAKHRAHLPRHGEKKHVVAPTLAVNARGTHGRQRCTLPRGRLPPRTTTTHVDKKKPPRHHKVVVSDGVD